MAAAIVIFVLAGFSAWLGWKKPARLGLIAAFSLSVIISLIAAFSIAVPSDVGGLWVFGISLIVLAAVSFASLGLGSCLHTLIRRDRFPRTDEKG
jgi:hypothetical protein